MMKNLQIIKQLDINKLKFIVTFNLTSIEHSDNTIDENIKKKVLEKFNLEEVDQYHLKLTKEYDIDAQLDGTTLSKDFFAVYSRYYNTISVLSSSDTNPEIVYDEQVDV